MVFSYGHAKAHMHKQFRAPYCQKMIRGGRWHLERFCGGLLAVAAAVLHDAHKQLDAAVVGHQLRGGRAALHRRRYRRRQRERHARLGALHNKLYLAMDR